MTSPPPAGNRPLNSAASATAPPGSTTSFNSRKAKATAARASSSLTATPPERLRRLSEKPSPPGIGASKASQIDPASIAGFSANAEFTGYTPYGVITQYSWTPASEVDGRKIEIDVDGLRSKLGASLHAGKLPRLKRNCDLAAKQFDYIGRFRRLALGAAKAPPRNVNH